MNEVEAAEKDILDAHEPSWVAQGYRVVRHPKRATLPAFLERFAPDAVLLGRHPQVVVEVVRKGQPDIAQKVRALNALLSEHSDWRLEVLYAGEEPESLPAVTTQRLKSSLASVRQLASVEPRSALLLLWATLEALGRRFEPGKTKRPQTPGRIVELLAGAGHVAPSEAEQLRQAAQWRNRLVHGDLDIDLSEQQIVGIANIVAGLVALLETHDAKRSTGKL